MRTPTRILSPLTERRTYLVTLHLLANLPLGIVWFTVVVTGLSLGLGMLITLVGVPILVATLLVGRVSGRVERLRARALLGLDVGEPAPLDRSRARWWWRALRTLVTDGLTWRSLAYDLLALPLGILTFTVTVTLWATVLGAITLPLWNWAIPGGAALFGDAQRVDTWWELVATTAAGVVLLPLVPWVMRGLGALNGALVRALLGPSRAQLDDRVRTLEASRDRSVDALAADRRRIERDLHDGVQQRLVALAVDLGRARDRLESGADPATVTELVAEAHEEAKRAVKEVRDLARGIHPAVLTDRGLDAALSSLAARSSVPVDIHVDVPVRPSATVESIAYFVVAESLTNVAKHSHATRAQVQVLRQPDRLVVRVDDDGEGGADLALGSGLSGLDERVRAVDGTFEVRSPTGGPTTILAELPCAS